jgi:hypothetical protein
MLRGGALPEVNGPAGSILWLWLDGLFTSSKTELLYTVKVLGGAPDIDPAGDELRKTTYSYENLYKAWRILKTCSMQYQDASGTRFDSTLELLADNYVIDAYAYWNIDKLNRSAWLARQTGIKATNIASGVDLISRPLCRPPPEGTPLALFDEYKASDDLIAREAMQANTISQLTARLNASEAELERLRAEVAAHPEIMERNTNEKVTSSMQTFQAQYAALQMQLAYVTKVKDENLKLFETSMATERQSNEAALKGYQARIADLQVVHADKIREIQNGLRAQVRKADEDNERTIKDLQKAASIEKERLRRELKAEFDRTLSRHAEDITSCNARVAQLTMQGKQDMAALQRDSESAVERAKEEVATCRQMLQKFTESFEKEKSALMKIHAESRDSSTRQLQDIVTRFDDMGDDRSSTCLIM